MPWLIQTAFISIFFSIFLLAPLFHHLFHDLFSANQTHLSPSLLTTSKPSQDHNLAIREPRTSRDRGDGFIPSSPLRAPPDSILFPDWEVLLLLPSTPPPSKGYSCLFQNGATSAATPVGFSPSSGRPTYKCHMPTSVRPLLTPEISPNGDKSPEMLRWNFLVYESLSTEKDVVLFAKGVNSRQRVNVPVTSLRCVFGDGVTTAVTSSFQEVFRCLHPDRPLSDSRTRISLQIRNGDKGVVVPSVATYDPSPRSLAARQGRALLCACTVVYNVAKFLNEWVIYHSRIGVEKFVLYDNGSDDDLASVVGRLLKSGHQITTVYWPWPKTQEAGFSHCAITFNDTCTWMMYTDVDEFAFSPRWQNESRPSKHLLQSLLPSTPSSIGQIAMRCFEFGPSNHRSHPIEGVTQGYTCRTRFDQRHKSIVLLDGVDDSLMNVIHHFEMKRGYKTRFIPLNEGVVNHYKYQVWSEFKHKFRRRVSAYVYDWKERSNLASKDRTPGLGNVAKEPKGWSTRFCEVNDTRLRDVSRGRGWFGLGGRTRFRLAWQEE